MPSTPSAGEGLVPLLGACADGKCSGLIAYVAQHAGWQWAGLVCVALAAVYWGYREWDWRWKAYRQQLTSKNETLDRSLLERLGRAATREVRLPALQQAEAVLTRLYGPRLFSVESFDRALGLAVAYPLVLMLLMWLFGAEGKLGTAVVLPANAAMWERWAIAALLLSTSAVGLWAMFGGEDAGKSGRSGLTREPASPAAKRSALFCSALAGAKQMGEAPVARVLVWGVVAYGTLEITKAFGNDGPSAIAATLVLTGPYLVHLGSGKRYVVGLASVTVAAVSLASLAGLAHVLHQAEHPTGASDALFMLVAALVVSCIVHWLNEALDALDARRRSQPLRRAALTLGFGCTWAAVVLPMAASPLWLPAVFSEKTWIFPVQRNHFIAVFFLTLLPLWNAVCDLISVAGTRVILRLYMRASQRPSGPAPWLWSACLAADLALAFGLTLVLLVGIFVLAAALQRLGWDVDALSLLREYEASGITGSGAFWLVSMSATNLLPTVLHLALLASAKASQRWSRGAADAPGWFYRLSSGERLSSTEAERVLWFLFASRLGWVVAFTAGMLVAGYFFAAELLSWSVPQLTRALLG